MNTNKRGLFVLANSILILAIIILIQLNVLSTSSQALYTCQDKDQGSKTYTLIRAWVSSDGYKGGALGDVGYTSYTYYGYRIQAFHENHGEFLSVFVYETPNDHTDPLPIASNKPAHYDKIVWGYAETRIPNWDGSRDSYSGVGAATSGFCIY